MKTLTSLLAIWLLAACSGATDGTEGTATPISGIQLVPALGGMKFELPVALVFPEESTETGYLVEQSGRILQVSDNGGSWSAREFLNIEARVNDRGREEGLLGLALDPDFESNGYVYVNYTASGPRRTVVSRFEVLTDSPGMADHDSETIVLEVGQPYSNHNGGHLLFGPDGYIYIGLGDGGSAGDPNGNGQDPGTLLGSIVRIDVSSADSSSRYTVPSDNPFIGVQGARPEIWAYGLRNPWRFSFDRSTGELWVADVGQNAWEEVDLIEAGGNYGWNVMEGNSCYKARADSCNQNGLEAPVAEYGRSDGCSITGGYVYRGRKLSWLSGKYLYGDFCSGKIWSYDPVTTQSDEVVETRLKISSFSEDSEGEIYVLSLDGGVYKLLEGGTEGE